MSHITTIDLQVKDLDALAKACGRLGLELVLGQKTFKWYGRFVGDTTPNLSPEEIKAFGKCDHAIRVKDNANAYEIGVVKRADGKGYALQWDSWQGGFGMHAKAGYGDMGLRGKDANINKLRDWYAAEVARKQMSKQGFQVNAFQRERKVEVLCSK